MKGRQLITEKWGPACPTPRGPLLPAPLPTAFLPAPLSGNQVIRTHEPLEDISDSDIKEKHYY